MPGGRRSKKTIDRSADLRAALALVLQDEKRALQAVRSGIGGEKLEQRIEELKHIRESKRAAQAALTQHTRLVTFLSTKSVYGQGSHPPVRTAGGATPPRRAASSGSPTRPPREGGSAEVRGSPVG